MDFSPRIGEAGRMTPLRSAALAATILALVPASASAAGGFLPPRNLAPARANTFPHAADFNARGEALFATNRDLGGGKGAILVDRRSPGGPIKRQVLPAGGSAQITSSTSVAADLARNGRGVVAWTQGDTLFYALRAPGGSFGAPQTVNVPPADTAGLDTVSVGIDNAGNVTFVWNTDVGTFPGPFTENLHGVQRRASDGAFVSSQLIDQPGNGNTAILEHVRVTASGRALLTYAITHPGPANGRFTFRDTAIGNFGPPTGPDSLNGTLNGAIDEHGDAAVAYEQDNVVRVRLRPAGGALGGAIDLEPTPGEAETPLVGLSGNAAATVVWTRTDAGTHKLVTCRVGATGCAPGSRSVITTSSEDLFPFALAEAPSGAAILTLDRSTNFEGTLLAVARTGPGPFRPARALGAKDSDDGLAGIDDAGDGLVSWRQDDAAHGVRFSGFDPNKPSVRLLSVPKKGRVGKPLHVAAKAFDVWGPVRYAWRFGDGSKAKGPTATHTYEKRGKRTVRLTVTDAAGNVRTATRTVKIRRPSAS
jgi:hypothetical protein